MNHVKYDFQLIFKVNSVDCPNQLGYYSISLNETEGQKILCSLPETEASKLQAHILQDIHNNQKCPLSPLLLPTEQAHKQEGFVYIIETQGVYKIGRASNLESRVKKYQTENPYPITLIASAFIFDCVSYEKRLHKKFAHKKLRGEWFKLNDNDLDSLKNKLSSEDLRFNK